MVFEASAQDLAGDKAALVALYNATNGPNWTNNDNWLSTEPVSEWYSVTVSNERVTGLDLHSNQLTGSIPPELGNLSRLTALDLGVNQLTGTIPLELGNLSSLTEMNFSYNQLTGNIPSELGNLSSLTGLYLSVNQLTGNIPPELGNLSSLTGLNLFNNQLTGSIPSELGNLSSLTYLALTQNQLAGNIPPELGNLSSLIQLHLSGNRLVGTIPPELGDLSNLRALVLSNNQLRGTIPSELTSLTSLRFFIFNLNANLCAQDDSAIRTWLAGVDEVQGPNCSPSVTLSVDPSELVEGAVAAVTVTAATAEATEETTVSLTLGGSAKKGTDYTVRGEEAITIPANNATGTTTLTFEPIADNLEEDNETILVEASVGNQVEGSTTITLSEWATVGALRYISFVPVILNAAGRNNSFFTSEMTLTNRGAEEAPAPLRLHCGCWRGKRLSFTP